MTDLLAARLARIPGGVNSPVRAFGSVGGDPFFVAKAEGAYLVDTDGNRYLDYVQSWGTSILGHAHPVVVEAVQRAAADGTSFGAPTVREVELAEAIADRVTSVEKVRLVSSGTEAAMTAVRLARGATGRAKILKFAGCYHGHLDSLLVAAGSGVATLGLPGSAGVTASTVADTVVVTFNDRAGVEAAFAEYGADLAAVLVEPIAANMGLVPPDPGFLELLRECCSRSGDGARVRRSDHRIPRRPWWRARPLRRPARPVDLRQGRGRGTPARGGGRTGIDHGRARPARPRLPSRNALREPARHRGGYRGARRAVRRRVRGTRSEGRDTQRRPADVLTAAGLAVTAPHAFTLGGLFFSSDPVHNYDDARAADSDRYARFFHEMLNRNIYLAPSAFEAIFPSLAHTTEEIEAHHSMPRPKQRKTSSNDRKGSRGT